MAKDLSADWKRKAVITIGKFAYKSLMMVLLSSGVYRAALWFGMDPMPAALGTLSAMMFLFAEIVLESRDKQSALLLERMDDWRNEWRRHSQNR